VLDKKSQEMHYAKFFSFQENIVVLIVIPLEYIHEVTFVDNRTIYRPGPFDSGWDVY